MIAVGYVRRSAKSDESTISLQAQEHAIANYCSSHALSLGAVVTHDGVSGGKRARFDDIERAMFVQCAKHLVIYNLDRLARDAAGLIDHLDAWHRGGITIHEVTSGVIDMKKALSRFITKVRGAMDELYREVVGEKTSDALAELRTRGRRYTNVPPLGFQHVQIGVNNKGYPIFSLVEHPEEQRALGVIAFCRAMGFGRVRTLRELHKAGYEGRCAPCTIEKALKRVTDHISGPEIPQ